jgi:hypothetical protein
MLFDNQKVNWKKGFFRLWVIFSLLWMILIFSFGSLIGHIRDYAIAYSSYTTTSSKVGEWVDAPKLTDEAVPDWARELSSKNRKLSEISDLPVPPKEWLLNDRRDSLIKILLAGFAPPIFGLVLWFAIAWVVKGFKPTVE